MAGTPTCWTLVQCWILVSSFTGVAAVDSAIVGLAIAGSVGFVFLVAIIFFVIISFSWSEWFNNWMRAKDKVRMPRAYWKKKEEARKRLISASQQHHHAPHHHHHTPSPHAVTNGQPPVQTVDRETVQSQNHIQNYVPSHVETEYNKIHTENHQPQGQTTLVQGWRQRSNQLTNVYEEKGVTMDIGEEHDDEFRIETVLTDNEVLDVGPFKGDHAHDRAIEGDIYPEPYIYSTVDSVKGAGDYSTTGATRVTTNVITTTVEEADTRPTGVYSQSARGGEIATNFEDAERLVQF